MLKYIIKRLLLLIPVILGISFVVFGLLEMAPGDAAQSMLGINATEESLAKLREELGLNGPFLQRYLEYVVNALQGDFGVSYRTKMPVVQEIIARIPTTVILATGAMALAVVVAITIGILSSVKQYSLMDNSTLAGALLLSSMPSFWLGTMLMLLFALKLHWLPATGGEGFKGYILPWITLAASYMAMLDGIKESLEQGKTPEDLERSISKAYGEPDFYLDTNRVYRSEKDVFDEYTQEERDRYFGEVPRTVWENLQAFDKYPEKLNIFKRDDVMTEAALESYREAVLQQWATELQNRTVPETMDLLRECRRVHTDEESVDYDRHYWGKCLRLRNELGKNSLEETCILTRIIEALKNKDYEQASALQIEMQEKFEELVELYTIYRKNLF